MCTFWVVSSLTLPVCDYSRLRVLTFSLRYPASMIWEKFLHWCTPWRILLKQKTEKFRKKIGFLLNSTSTQYMYINSSGANLCVITIIISVILTMYKRDVGNKALEPCPTKTGLYDLCPCHTKRGPSWHQPSQAFFWYDTHYRIVLTVILRSRFMF